MSQGATQTEQQAQRVPGGTAEKPTDVPAKGWLAIAKRGWAEAKVDNVPLLAAGMAYYAFLAIFPALIAAVLIYGLVADPAQIAAQVNSLGSAIPQEIRQTITDQITVAEGRGAGWGAVVAILLALFSASGGVGNMMTAINTAYDEEETRGFVKKRLTALALTLGAIVFLLLVVGLVAVLPGVLQVLGTSTLVTLLIQVVRWVLIVVVISVALAVLYRVAPDRDAPKLRWVSVGAAIATVLWIIASVGFSLYVSHFGSYAKTYGALAGIVILLLWLFITSYAILLGAEINAESEQQTIADTTKGPSQPIGKRDAVKADTVPEPEDGSAGKGAGKQK
jgi:membrane protein